MSDQRKDRPFSIPDNVIKVAPSRRVNRVISSLLERTFGLSQLQSLYQALPPARDDREFLQQVFDTFNIGYKVDDEALARIPRSGPTVIVANHPFGALEGVILAALLRSIRSDVKIMANFILSRVPEISDLFISVNPYSGSHAAKVNVSPMRQAIRWVKDGGLLVVFPAGEVSYWSPRKRTIADPPWSKTVSRIVHRANADVLPIYFDGANSLLFQVAGLMHPRVRTALLPRELMNKANTSIEIQIGRAIPYNKLKSFDDQALIDHLRLRTYLLKDASNPVAPRVTRRVGGEDEGLEPIVEAVDPTVLTQEINALDSGRCLLESGDMRVYYAEADEIPGGLREIGRLRELTFRSVGEGTGQSIDLDRYDDYYLHLFIWNSVTLEIVGAYRLGQGDVIMERFGKRGFYSHSLFKYRTRLLEKLNPALEMGRSFVRIEYQRSFSPLMLLWKGISQYVYRNPQYRRLFGPVSISSEYRALSQQLIVEFLRDHAGLPDMSCDVKPRKPFRAEGRRDKQTICRDIDDLDIFSDLLSSIEPDAKGIPILLRQYLKLGGRILGFNVDPDFSNVLDGLMMVDLMETDAKVLAKYMGRSETRAFRLYHGVDGSGREGGIRPDAA